MGRKSTNLACRDDDLRLSDRAGIFDDLGPIAPPDPKTLASNLVLRNYVPPSNVVTGNPLPNAVNGSLWSIPFEFSCNIDVAALGVMGLQAHRPLLAGAAVAVLVRRVVLDLLDRKPGWGILGLIFGWPYLRFQILPSFLLGMLAFQFKEQIPRSRALFLGLAGATVVVARVSPHLAHLLLTPTLAYATLYCAYSSVRPLAWLTEKGGFSYGTYRYAFPIQQILYAVYGRDLLFPIYVVLAAVLSLLAGVASWHLVEKRFIARVSRVKPERLSGATGRFRRRDGSGPLTVAA